LDILIGFEQLSRPKEEYYTRIIHPKSKAKELAGRKILVFTYIHTY